MNETATNEYTILLDRLAITDAYDLPDTDDAICAAFVALAAAHNATFTNVRVVPATDTHTFSSADVTVAFTATPTDVARYADANDLPDDTIVAS